MRGVGVLRRATLCFCRIIPPADLRVDVESGDETEGDDDDERSSSDAADPEEGDDSVVRPGRREAAIKAVAVGTASPAMCVGALDADAAEMRDLLRRKIAAYDVAWEGVGAQCVPRVLEGRSQGGYGRLW